MDLYNDTINIQLEEDFNAVLDVSKANRAISIIIKLFLLDSSVLLVEIHVGWI